MADVLFFESHPVQYKAPVYQHLQTLWPDAFEVIYATDSSVRQGHVDHEFGVEVVWDTPLLSGYRYRVLGNERGRGVSSRWGLTGRGVLDLLRQRRPAAVVLTQCRYPFDFAAYGAALLLGIPVVIRQETQDNTFKDQRGWAKSLLRHAAYRLLYAPVRHAFAFGALNLEHLRRHGLTADRVSLARFSVVNPFMGWSVLQKQAAAQALRQRLGIPSEQKVLGFFGKFIAKKDPELIFEALAHMPALQRRRCHLLFVGAGVLEARLRELAGQALVRWGVHTTFTGFVNQTALPAHYLATDVLVLPSRHLGEAWGLVVNEGLNAGCGVAITEGVGCHVEFSGLARVRVTPVQDAVALGASLASLVPLAKEFSWAESAMRDYSTEAAASAIARYFRRDSGLEGVSVDEHPLEV